MRYGGERLREGTFIQRGERSGEGKNRHQPSLCGILSEAGTVNSRSEVRGTAKGGRTHRWRVHVVKILFTGVQTLLGERIEGGGEKIRKELNGARSGYEKEIDRETRDTRQNKALQLSTFQFDKPTTSQALQKETKGVSLAKEKKSNALAHWQEVTFSSRPSVFRGGRRLANGPAGSSKRKARGAKNPPWRGNQKEAAPTTRGVYPSRAGSGLALSGEASERKHANSVY